MRIFYGSAKMVNGAILLLALAAVMGCKEEGASKTKLPGRDSPLDVQSVGLGPASSAVPVDLSKGWCSGHGVPESVCTRCNAALVPKFKETNDWCAEHELPESQCALCHPEVKAKWAAVLTGDSAAVGQVGVTGHSNEGLETVVVEEVPRSQRPPSVTCSTGQLRVRFKTQEIARQAGLEFVEVERRPVRQTITRNAQIAYDQNRFAHLTSQAPGVVREVVADLGAQVRAGEALAVVESVELAGSKAEYLQTVALESLCQKNQERSRLLQEQGAASQKEALKGETELAEARINLARATQKLRTFGLNDERIEELKQSGETSAHFAVRAVLDGRVVERTAVIGQVVESSEMLFSIADTSRMWAIVEAYDSDLLRVRLGQAVLLTVEGLRGETFGGRITWISSEVDSRTRTLKVRVEIDNTSGLLRANMFGRAVITVHDNEPLVVVPREAVQWEGCCNIVFVRESETLYEPRKISPGYEQEEFYTVLAGLSPGETVVTKGSFLLKTEILKGSIGAGCCDVSHLDK